MPKPGRGPLLGIGAAAEVFAYGEHALKLYKPGMGRRETFREAGVLAALDGSGLPVPEVFEAGLYGDRWGLVMTRIDGRSYFDAMKSTPALFPALLADMVALQARMHRQRITGLPTFKSRLKTAISRAPALDEATRAALLDKLSAMPDGDQLCHGDFHPLNIIGEPGAASVVDWLDASIGDPAADVCRTCLIFLSAAPEHAKAYAEGYAMATGMEMAAIVSWLPFIAGARLAESSAKGQEDMLMLLASGMPNMRSPWLLEPLRASTPPP
jgi:aminoglycoside phosphotransferase (APT) family kinase protein